MTPHGLTFLRNQTLDRSHVAGGNLGRKYIAVDRSLGCREGENWLAAGMLVTERADPKPHPRYVALAAIEIGNSAIGRVVSPHAEKFPPKSKQSVTLLLSPDSFPTLFSLETHVHW
jgi:hypothetical protein